MCKYITSFCYSSLHMVKVQPFCVASSSSLSPPPLSLMEKLKARKEKQGVQNKVEVELAAIAISLNISLRSADMPVNMQERALRFTRSLVDATPNTRLNHTHLARALKKEFDSLYGPAWHCVVGKSFGSFVTHSPGGFVYFSLDSLSILLFKTEVHLVKE